MFAASAPTVRLLSNQTRKLGSWQLASSNNSSTYRLNWVCAGSKCLSTRPVLGGLDERKSTMLLIISLWFTLKNKSCIPELPHMLLRMFGAPPRRHSGHVLTLCRHLQRRADTDSQQRTPAEGKLLQSCLCSSHPTTFIISSSLRWLRSSITSASSFALLVFGTDLTTALQCSAKMHQLTCFPSFFPTCKVFDSKASPFTVHACSNVFLFASYTPPRSIHLWPTSEVLLKQETFFLVGFMSGNTNIWYLVVCRVLWIDTMYEQICKV